MMEIWKDIKGYEGLYQVSNLGRVKSLKNREKILNPFSDNNYLNVDLFKNRKKKRYKIHRLVAITFIPNIDNKPEVNHIDGNKENNCISNLEWTTSSENMQHAFKMGLAKVNKNMKGRFGTDNPNSKPVNQYTLDNEPHTSWDSTKDIERELKIHHSHISKCCKGKLKTAGGYVWKYERRNDLLVSQY